MPTTVNGIGATYYGKKNLKTSRGHCSLCNHDVELQEYETMYWVVVLYIPVIPLGRKQILNYCMRCRRHRVLPLAKWEEVKEQTIAEHTAALAENHDDPETSLKLLHALSAFNRLVEAEKLAAGIQTRFDDRADVQLQMGQWHDFRGRRAEADACYRAAVELEPENLPAKHAMALGLMAGGEPDKALALAKTPPQITPEQNPNFYLALGHANQKLNRHAEALAAFAPVVEAFPKLGYDKALRKSICKSEKLAGEGTSMLPRIAFYRSPRVLIPGLAVAIIAAVLLSNHYLATHHTLHVVNGFARPMEVQLDGQPPITVAPRESQTVAISEGSHVAAVTADGRPVHRDQFAIESNFMSRFLDSPVFILNAGAGAAILWEQAIYAKNPMPGSARVHIGTPFVDFGDIDYLFVPFPPQIKTERGTPVSKTRVSLLELDPEQIFFLNPGTVSPSDQLVFAEAHLAIVPDNKTLLHNYVQVGAGSQQADRVRQFLAVGLDKTPVWIEWHRMAQALNTTDAQNEQFRQRYAEWLLKEPNNSAILYLKARLEPHDAALAGFDRAIEADPANPYPWFAKGYQLHNVGDLAGAKAAFEKATALSPTDEDFRNRLFDVRLALGELPELERELSDASQLYPYKLDSHLQRLEVLAAAGKLSQARDVTARYQRDTTALPDAGENGKQAAQASQITILYLNQEFAELLALAQQPELADSLAHLRYQCHLEMGECDAAAVDLKSKPGVPDGFDLVRLSICARMSGKAEKAAELQQEACAQFDQGLKEQRLVSSLLGRAADATVEETSDLNFEPRRKATLLIALAQQSTSHRDELLAMAEKLNSSRLFPYTFHWKAIAALREAK
jgi:tetratricopeptide (TPR) repeat protein